MTGANFAVAETGGFVVCTNEGNADISRQRAQIAHRQIGIEKLIPKVEHLGVFIRHAVAQRLGLADHAIYLAFPRPRAKARSCTWCWSITADRSGWAWRISGIRSNASAAGRA